MTDLVQQVESAVLTQLHGVRGLCSLQVQNHIYGCYILMEDIAMSHVTVTDTTVSIEGYSFDYEAGFSEIGLRYGFLMDTTLELVSWLPEYKDAWMRCFAAMHASPDVTVVDHIEDKVNHVVQQSVPAEEAFFLNAVEHGTLTRGWIDKVLRLLRGGEKTSPPIPAERGAKEAVETVETVDTVETVKTGKTGKIVNNQVPLPLHNK